MPACRQFTGKEKLDLLHFFWWRLSGQIFFRQVFWNWYIKNLRRGNSNEKPNCKKQKLSCLLHLQQVHSAQRISVFYELASIFHIFYGYAIAFHSCIWFPATLDFHLAANLERSDTCFGKENVVKWDDFQKNIWCDMHVYICYIQIHIYMWYFSIWFKFVRSSNVQSQYIWVILS